MLGPILNLPILARHSTRFHTAGNCGKRFDVNPFELYRRRKILEKYGKRKGIFRDNLTFNIGPTRINARIIFPKLWI